MYRFSSFSENMDMDSTSRTPRSRSPIESRAQSPRPPRGPRDHAASWMSSGLFAQHGESYSEQYGSAVGSAGQDMSRLSEGPSRYINDTPNIGTKATLAREVVTSPRGRVAFGVFSGPAQYTDQVISRKLHCTRAYAGPDPYHVSTTARSATAQPAHAPGRFATESRTSERRSPHILGRTAAHAFDPYSVSTRAVANSWRRESNSIKSLTGNPMPTMSHSARGSPFVLSVNHRIATPTYNRMPPAKLELLPVMRSARFGGGGYPFA